MSMTSERRRPSGVVLILVSTVIAGGAAYLLMPIVAGQLGRSSYAAFAVYWSALYLVISALSGIQQEVTRATRLRPENVTTRQNPTARNFAVIVSILVLAFCAGSAFIWAHAVFPDDGWSLVVPLSVGVASYVIVAVLCGVLYGLNAWVYIALMIGVDGVLRFILVAGVLVFTRDLTVLAWAAAAPFLLTPAILWLFMRRQVVGRFQLDVGFRALSWNVSRTVIGSAATGVIVSGFPLLLSATSASVQPAEIGVLVLAITLTRAPIVIAVLSLQSYLVIYFRTHSATLGSALIKIIGVIAVGTAVLAGLAGMVGSWLLITFIGPEYELDGGLLALLVASAGAVAALCATGPAVLSRSDHVAFTGGWVVAALATIALLLVPGSLEIRAVLALGIGPLCGLAVHAFALWQGTRARAVAARS